MHSGVVANSFPVATSTFALCSHPLSCGRQSGCGQLAPRAESGPPHPAAGRNRADRRGRSVVMPFESKSQSLSCDTVILDRLPLVAPPAPSVAWDVRPRFAGLPKNDGDHADEDHEEPWAFDTPGSSGIARSTRRTRSSSSPTAPSWSRSITRSTPRPATPSPRSRSWRRARSTSTPTASRTCRCGTPPPPASPPTQMVEVLQPLHQVPDPAEPPGRHRRDGVALRPRAARTHRRDER